MTLSDSQIKALVATFGADALDRATTTLKTLAAWDADEAVRLAVFLELTEFNEVNDVGAELGPKVLDEARNVTSILDLARVNGIGPKRMERLIAALKDADLDAAFAAHGAQPKPASAGEPASGDVMLNAVRLAADTLVVPGASLMLGNNFQAGAVRAVAGPRSSCHVRTRGLARGRCGCLREVVDGHELGGTAAEQANGVDDLRWLVVPDNDAHGCAEMPCRAQTRQDVEGLARFRIGFGEVAVFRLGHCGALAQRERITAVAELARQGISAHPHVRAFAVTRSPPRSNEMVSHRSGRGR